MALLAIRGLRKNFGAVEILKGVDFTVEKGEFVCLLGSSGCGRCSSASACRRAAAASALLPSPRPAASSPPTGLQPKPSPAPPTAATAIGGGPSRSGMAENFEAQTGDGLCDPTFAWASAAYLWLPAPQFSSQSG